MRAATLAESLTQSGSCSGRRRSLQPGVDSGPRLGIVGFPNRLWKRDLGECDPLLVMIFPPAMEWKGVHYISDLLHSQVCEAAAASWLEAVGAQRVEEKLRRSRDSSEE